MTDRYFYTKHHPFRWSSGPDMSFINPQKGYAEIKSLEEAKELAEHFAFVSYNEDHCTTTYGVSYTVEG